MRTCRACQKDESEVRFYDPTTTSGKAAGSMCQPCWVGKAVTWRRANRDRWNRKVHARLLFRQFGVTQDVFDAIYKDPVCSGCGATESKYKWGNKRLALDHDHKTKLIRGLLCHDCNRTIATAHDNPVILRQLADYLEAHNSGT